jgi:hypothetical protein
VNLLFAASDASFESLGLMKMFGTFNMATIETASLTQLYLELAVIMILECKGSSGKSLIYEPIAVKSPSSSRAPR